MHVEYRQSFFTLRGPVPPVWRRSKPKCLFLVLAHMIFSSWSFVSHPIVFPGGSKTNLVLLCCFLSMHPIHLHFFFLICYCILSWCVSFHKFSLLMTSGHRMFRTERKHLTAKVRTLSVISFLVNSPGFRTIHQDSFPFVWNDISLVFRLICFDFQTALRRRNVVQALSILAFTSCSASLVITLPR